MKVPSIGELNRRVELRERVDQAVADSDVEATFPQQRFRWAKIEPVGSAVYAASVQIDKKVTHRITVRYLDGITDAFEIVYRTQVFAVKRVSDLNGARRFTVLEVEEIQHG
ncbi:MULTISPECIES: phage head closure protein [unclassified Herbaspirillum]|uniref:phage head closure protein n=1 Tax=unclassified Herbaspirillum TaxID=2624150 RepID=UPI000E2F54AC|nr:MULTISPECIES: phage head closure protein [unclassified Herbaspirillum]RFB73826.1 head-tail adaptor protein [Herbaspirillum sp. 3R-3a1]TFI10363.1 head-tail adaptor protein [Herbaspirillum sp. 3R11]TFI16267.1 head-tail adaptor protein [Herbaspirillum sp. 3R-11]TFI28364.1 head-tail adaptor protein [Herbaspirillum sp. 3C11]